MWAGPFCYKRPGVRFKLILLFTSFLAIAFARQRFLCPAFFTGL